MERRKARGISTDDDNQLALVKAAAWAWYQHGSGSDTRSIREYDVTSNDRAPKPSRYKQEAIRDVQQQMDFSSSCSAIPIHLRADNSLLDTYEIERISRQLDRYIESSKAKYYGNYNGFVVSDQAKVVSLTENGIKETEKIKQRKQKWRGFWLRHPVICGSSKADVVGGTTTSSGCLAKHVPVVDVAQCRPRKP